MRSGVGVTAGRHRSSFFSATPSKHKPPLNIAGQACCHSAVTRGIEYRVTLKHAMRRNPPFRLAVTATNSLFLKLGHDVGRGSLGAR